MYGSEILAYMLGIVFHNTEPVWKRMNYPFAFCHSPRITKKTMAFCLLSSGWKTERSLFVYTLYRKKLVTILLIKQKEFIYSHMVKCFTYQESCDTLEIKKRNPRVNLFTIFVYFCQISWLKMAMEWHVLLFVSCLMLGLGSPVAEDCPGKLDRFATVEGFFLGFFYDSNFHW